MSIKREQVFVWSRNIRLFHWVNVIAITLLVCIGLVILNGKLFGVSTDGKVLLKTIHVIVGYVFAINLLFRLLLGFIGKAHERWNKILPFNKGFSQELVEFKQHKNPAYKGHNPAGKLMVLALFLLMSTQLISGLVIAGTDIYYPPFGHYFAESIAIDKDNVAEIKPYSKENVDEVAYKNMREIRSPFITAHVYAFYSLLFLIPLHIFGVIIAERREKTALVSAMITGYKYLPKNKSK
ncbi:cytochrome b/b6 domain-containing protein [Colwellia sp. M166]|uniref:cytochrome b/b6 domain-containing protein n=1 Tax=Colwellia sp. M166 TaxID=2583805 RepID=UPI00211E33B6|nr:cytochrome b/b6 domain-containing protein [Colwellia sp. M166]UUO24202.1 cytochrome b/b6 domain-containing protein [Colwellia sp. M166]|tara:strand:+ start:50611 stop:51324 length:714 start_codon:yes stop_codon:yes gene_type:complete